MPSPAWPRRFGGPIWWNTPLEEDGTGQDENRTTWQQRTEGGEGGEGEAPPGPSISRKRPADDFAADDDEMPDEVRARLDALKKGARKLD